MSEPRTERARLDAIHKELEGWHHGEDCSHWDEDHDSEHDVCDCGLTKIVVLSEPQP